MSRALVAAGIVIALVASGLAAAGQGLAGPYSEGDYGEYDEGVHVGTVLQRELSPFEPGLMRVAGIESVRIWIDWSRVARERGHLNWRDPDDLVRQLAGAGLTTAPFLFGTPGWAAREDGFDCEREGCERYAPSSLETRAAFAQFAAAAARRYGADGAFWDENPRLAYRPVQAWQIWNEPNLQEFWRPWVDPLGYAELVRLASQAIRAEDPEAEILLAGLSGARTTTTRWSPPTFLSRFYSVQGIGESFDGVALHPYARRTRGMLARIEASRNVYTVFDRDVDLWITEIGWASSGPREWSPERKLQRQAKMLRLAFTRLIRRSDDLDLRGIYWYAWRDTHGYAVCEWCGKAGLRDRDGKAKPAYHALRRFAARWL